MGFNAIAGAVEALVTRSPTLRLASLAVLEASRDPMAMAFRHVAPFCRLARSVLLLKAQQVAVGATMIRQRLTHREADDPLLDAVQSRLASGALFPVDRRGWAGRGSGKSCAVCDLTINDADLEYEVADGPGSSAFAHVKCYLVWRQESEVLRWATSGAEREGQARGDAP